MAILTATSGEILLKPGVYDAIITGVAEKERDGRKFLVWCFEVKYGSKTTRVRRPTSMSFGPRSAARSIVEAALGRRLRDGESVNTDDLAGSRVQVVISRATRSDGEETNRVESVLPAKDEDDLPF